MQPVWQGPLSSQRSGAKIWNTGVLRYELLTQFFELSIWIANNEWWILKTQWIESSSFKWKGTRKLIKKTLVLRSGYVNGIHATIDFNASTISFIRRSDISYLFPLKRKISCSHFANSRGYWHVRTKKILRGM